MYDINNCDDYQVVVSLFIFGEVILIFLIIVIEESGVILILNSNVDVCSFILSCEQQLVVEYISVLEFWKVNICFLEFNIDFCISNY